MKEEKKDTTQHHEHDDDDDVGAHHPMVAGSPASPPSEATRSMLNRLSSNASLKKVKEFILSKALITSAFTFLFGLCLAFAISYLIYIFYLNATPTEPECLDPPEFKNHFDDINEGIIQEHKQTIPLLLQNARLMGGGYPMDHDTLYFLFINDGKISSISTQMPEGLPGNTQVVDLAGKIVTPGIVDMHSHFGVYPFPSLAGNQDGNEMTTPATPFVRAIDALNPKDRAISQMLEFGVTTAQILPGSGNVIGGEGVIVKTKGQTVSNMYVRRAPRILKMACGENPKRVYGSRRQMPSSRMGNAWVMRQKFEEAQKLMASQDAWDCNPQNKYKDKKHRPNSLELEPLVGLLRGKNVILNVHCYEVHDIEMMIRLSNEFRFKINAFHHGLEAYMIPEVIKQNNITVATFSDLTGYKKEAFSASVYAPKILHDSGVDVALKSDHPVIHSKEMIYQAGKSHYFGLNSLAALDAITTVPAKAIGMSDRIGYLRGGYDADLVVWDRHPLRLGATPDKVLIEGKIFFDKQLAMRSNDLPSHNGQLVIKSGVCDAYQQATHYALENVKVYTMDSSGTVLQNANVIVQNGNITCIGSASQCPINAPTVFTVEGGILIPGIIQAASSLGLVEIESETSTYDGYGEGMIHGSSENMVIAKDGLRMESIPVTNAFRAGVTTVVTHRQGTYLVNGLSSTFVTSEMIASQAVVKGETAVQFTLGDSARYSSSGIVSSISGQVAQLRSYFTRAQQKLAQNTSNSDYFVKLLQRELPAVFMVNQADDIGQLLDLQMQFGFKLVIVGGAESHLLAERLKNQDVSVIIGPFTEGTGPGEIWDTLRTANDWGAAKLYQSGVRLGVGSFSVYEGRNIRWSAGLLSTDGFGAIPHQEALAMITRNIAQMFGIDEYGFGSIKVGTRANMVLFNGNPLTFEGKNLLVAVGTTLLCNPSQTP